MYVNNKLKNYKKKHRNELYTFLQKKIKKKKIGIYSGRIRIRNWTRIRICYPGSGSALKISGSETLQISIIKIYIWIFEEIFPWFIRYLIWLYIHTCVGIRNISHLYTYHLFSVIFSGVFFWFDVINCLYNSN